LFLGNTSLYLIGAGPIIKNGQTIDGPRKILFRQNSLMKGRQHLLAALCGFIHWIAQLLHLKFGFDAVETKGSGSFGIILIQAAEHFSLKRLMATQYTIGLDYGTNSVRALIVTLPTARRSPPPSRTYSHGTHGVILARDPNLARQQSGGLRQGCGDHHQAGACCREENVRVSMLPKSSASAWTRRAAHHCRGCERQPLAFSKKFAIIRRRWRGCGRITPV